MNFLTLTLLIFFAFAKVASAETSALWGNDGERWSSQSRLPDFSFAGYRSSEQTIPELPPLINIKDYGAVGNGRADDTQAFLNALNSLNRGVVFVPNGTYKISDVIAIRRSGIVIRGESSDRTVLFFPHPLSKMMSSSRRLSPGESWSWFGGVISVEGTNRGERLANVTQPTERGSTRLKVSRVDTLRVGQRVRLIMQDVNGHLGKYLHADQAEPSSLLKGKKLIDFSFTILAIEKNEVVINRPLRSDVRLEWKPALFFDSPSVEEVGIENLSIEFVPQKYTGHHKEPGFNAILFQGVANSWARNIKIRNADAGIIFRGNSRFCTVDNIQFEADRKRILKGIMGHHGILMADYSQDNLVSNFNVKGRFVHDLCVTTLASGNVFMKGQGKDMTFDHHRKIPFENLFTEIDAGKGSELWLSGGDLEAGPHSGARETFWNIKSNVLQNLPSWAIQFNVVGINTKLSTQQSEKENWVEPFPPESVQPVNLFEAQLRHRQKHK